MEVFYVTWQTETPHRWCVTCPSLPPDDQYERRHWCYSQNMDFVNVGVRFWFVEEKDVNWFVLRWS